MPWVTPGVAQPDIDPVQVIAKIAIMMRVKKNSTVRHIGVSLIASARWVDDIYLVINRMSA